MADCIQCWCVVWISLPFKNRRPSYWQDFDGRRTTGSLREKEKERSRRIWTAAKVALEIERRMGSAFCRLLLHTLTPVLSLCLDCLGALSTERLQDESNGIFFSFSFFFFFFFIPLLFLDNWSRQPRARLLAQLSWLCFISFDWENLWMAGGSEAFDDAAECSLKPSGIRRKYCAYE